MFQNLRRLRSAELQLLITVLLFFTAGYLLVVAATRASEFIPTVRGVADILWPSVLPFVLFLGVSLGMGWRNPRADQVLLPSFMHGASLLSMPPATPVTQ